MNFRVCLPNEEKGYVIFDLYKPNTFIISNRIISFKPSFDDSFILIPRHTKYVRANFQFKEEGHKKKISITTGMILELAIPCGIRFVEPCYINIHAKNPYLQQISTPIISTNLEQIKVLCITKVPHILIDNEYMIDITIPFPFQYELFPTYELEYDYKQ